jgi:exosortase A-associated hydrolase 2
VRPPLRGHFLAGPAGPLAIVVWEPPPGTPCTFATLSVPAAGDEMNKSRRIVAVQARALARSGARVAVLDPRGTGDSVGDHALATWSGWREDVVAAWRWLQAIAPLPGVLWGMRLGGLLAADIVSSGALAPDVLALWQPVASGRVFFNQFLRVATSRALIGRDDGATRVSMRDSIAGGRPVEVAGYALDAALIDGAQAVELGDLAPRGARVIWRETTIAEPAELSSASSKTIERWRSAGIDVDAGAVAGASFWASQELAEAPELIASTTDAITRVMAQRQAQR